MISEVHTHEDPILTREEAIEILNTPDDQLDALIERAGILRKKYKGNHVSIHILTNVRSGNQDAMSRHRGAKPLRRCELLGVISLLSPG